MPNIKSAKKRVSVNAKKRERNRSESSEIKTAIKNYYNAIDTNNIDEAETLLPKLFALLDSSASNGLIHKNNAANKKSQAAKRLHDVKTGKTVIVIKKDNKTIAAEKAKLAKDSRDAARAEYQKAAADKKAKKQEAEAAAIALAKENEKKPKKEKADAKKTEVKAEPKAEKKPAKAKAEEPAEPKAEKKPAKAKVAKTEEKAE